MSQIVGGPWSNDPNAPQIPYTEYFGEKAYFAGFVTGAIFYGIVVVLFFKCTSTLLDPANRLRGGIRWGLVAHTTAMFSFVTIYNGMYLNLQSISFVDYRAFPGLGDYLSPGPLGYQYLIYTGPMCMIPHIVFLLNTWLADGLLLYRCYVIYAMNYWYIAFPCLMYLASMAVGVILLYYQATQPTLSNWSPVASSFKYPFFSISPSLNILLTIMIVTRLVLCNRSVRNAGGAPVSTLGLYKAVITMLVESSALYAVSFILFIGPWAAESFVANIFLPILSQNQVIAPFLIILRVANRRALTSDMTNFRTVSSARFKSWGKSTGVTGSDVYPMDSMETEGETSR